MSEFMRIEKPASTNDSSAIALAQRYLIMVSTTNNSSVARAAAQELIPETQH